MDIKRTLAQVLYCQLHVPNSLFLRLLCNRQRHQIMQKSKIDSPIVVAGIDILFFRTL